MTHDKVNNQYFKWLFDLVCEGRFSKQISYKKLLMYLHTIEFRYQNPRDWNRAQDGKDLRYRYAIMNGYADSPEMITDELEGPCSVLEMIMALAIRCEECIMDDPHVGDRTSQWFWGMINNLGLGSMTDDRFDRQRADNVVRKFLDRKYEPNGRGGLFTIRNCDRDLRYVEIWTQLCWYLDGFS